MVRNCCRVSPVPLTNAEIQTLDSHFAGHVKSDLPVDCFYVEFEREAYWVSLIADSQRAFGHESVQRLEGAFLCLEGSCWPTIHVKHFEVKQIVQNLGAINLDIGDLDSDHEIARARIRRVDIESRLHILELALVGSSFV